MAIKRRIDTVDTQARRTFFGESDFDDILDEIEYKYAGPIQEALKQLDFVTAEAKEEMDKAYQMAMLGFEAEKHSIEDIVKRQEEIQQKLCSMGIHFVNEQESRLPWGKFQHLVRGVKRCIWCEKTIEASRYFFYEHWDRGIKRESSEKEYENLDEFYLPLWYEDYDLFGCNHMCFNEADYLTYEYLKAYFTHKSPFTFITSRCDTFRIYLHRNKDYEAYNEKNNIRTKFRLRQFVDHQDKPIPKEAVPLLEELSQVLFKKNGINFMIKQEDARMKTFRENYLERLKRMHIPLDEEEDDD